MLGNHRHQCETIGAIGVIVADEVMYGAGGTGGAGVCKVKWLGFPIRTTFVRLAMFVTTRGTSLFQCVLIKYLHL